jgi:ABC-type taurine transport system ATPase subunit
VLAVLCIRAQDKNIGILIAACFALLTAWLTVKCISTLRRIAQPALVVGHAGLTFENGMLIPWPNIVENIWVNQSYMGIPIGKQIQIRTDLPKPKARVLRRAMALEITGDEYLALCDAYR